MALVMECSSGTLSSFFLFTFPFPNALDESEPKGFVNE